MKPIAVRSLSYAAGGRLILENVDFEVEEGAFVGLIGPNGGGKTTLLRILLGAVRGWSGEVRVFGRSPLGLGSRRHLIAYVPQQDTSSVDFPATAHDVVTMGRVGVRGIWRRLGEDDHRTALAMLERVGMAEHAGRQVNDLSGGQRQRVLIARALVSGPRLLILDEPTTGIDQAAEESFFGLLASLKRELGLTIVMASHDIAMVSEHCSTVACLNQRMHCHDEPARLDHAVLSRIFGEHFEIFIHGDVPHRVVRRHVEDRGADRSDHPADQGNHPADQGNNHPADQGKAVGESQGPDQGNRAPDQDNRAPDQDNRAPNQDNRAPDQGNQATAGDGPRTGGRHGAGQALVPDERGSTAGEAHREEGGGRRG